MTVNKWWFVGKITSVSDNLTSNMKVLEALDQRPEYLGPLLLHLLCAKMDNETLKAWEISSPKDRMSSVKELVQFLEERFKIMESIESSQNIVKNRFTGGKNSQRGTITCSAVLISTEKLKRYFCNHINKSHSIYKCSTFFALSVNDRINKIYEFKLCKIYSRK